MTNQIHGRVVLVTGAGSGIGRATALAFAADGAVVVASGRGKESLAETVTLIQRNGGRGDSVVADVTSNDAVVELIDSVVTRHGGLHVAVNNAGVVGPTGPVADIDEAQWRALFDLNVTGTWLCLKHEIQHMRAHGGGTIVNVASNIGAHMRRPGMAAYAASKAAVSALTRAAARDHIADGVRINAVSPGHRTPRCPCEPVRRSQTETPASRSPYHWDASAPPPKSQPRSCGWPRPRRHSPSATTS